MLTAKERREIVQRECRNGPFGGYEPGVFGHLLNSLVRYYNLPLTLVEHLTIGNETINKGNSVFAKFKYVDEIEFPLVRFTDVEYHQHRFIREGNQLIPIFNLALSHNGTPAFIFTDAMLTNKLKKFISSIMFKDTMNELFGNYTNPLFLDIKTLLNTDGIYLDFDIGNHRAPGVVQWMDYLNDNFRVAV